MSGRTYLFVPGMIAVLVALSGCNKPYDYQDCPNGTRIILLDNNQVFDAYASEVSFELNAAAKTKGKIVEASVGTKYDKKIKQLYEQLDNVTAQFKTELYAEYAVYLTGTCNASTPDERQRVAEAWAEARRRAQDYALKLRELNRQIATVQGASSGTGQQLERMIRIGDEALMAGRIK